MTVYVCYEENYHELAYEVGEPVSCVVVFDSSDKALVWYAERVESGIRDGFVIDREDELFDGVGSYDPKLLRQSIERGCDSMMMFRGRQENWDESYRICIEKREVL